MTICIAITTWVIIHIMMKTIQMTLDEELLGAVDKAALQMKATRSEFARRALRAALERLRTRELERRHREGYRRAPVRKGEFDAWEREHAWGDE
jgi:Arc/MetJ family transcription regulator